MGNGDTSKMLGRDDILVDTNIDSKLIFKYVRHILDLWLNLILTCKLDKEGYDVHFGKGSLKFTKESFVVIREKKCCTL